MPKAFWQGVHTHCQQRNISLQKHEKEKGEGQYEIALLPSDAASCANNTKLAKQLISDLAGQYGLKADFSAKPLPDQPGSGLHIHVHLENSMSENVFYKKDEIISDELKFSISGLLATMQESMPVFAPTEASYARFVERSNAPLTISWGANNRTVAVRLPDSAHDNKRIEHRVAGADAEPEAVIAAILSGIHHGLMHKPELPPQIYGDAALDMYELPKLKAILLAQP